ncbi:MAG: class I SAM-dependent methyltransferase [Candidatus Methanomethyliaceae archaeon]
MSVEIYRCERLPVLQNRVYDTALEGLSSPCGDIVLVQDQMTGIVCNAAFTPELIVYDSNYHNEQALSSIFRNHLVDVTRIIERHFRGCKLVEVGCGKGYFLEQLLRSGFDIWGIDPAYDGENPRVIKSSFGRDINLHAEGIVLRHVLEHIPNPYKFLKELCDSNGGKGIIYIEVPCLEWIARYRAWFDIYYEHVNYFRVSDFKRLFGRILEFGWLFGNQYVYTVADLASLRDIQELPEAPPFVLPVDFTASIDLFAKFIRDRSVPTIVWGASSKGVVFSLQMMRADAIINFVVDINPAKQGRYLPGSGLRIHSPTEVLEQVTNGDVYVMNSNYLPEIRSITGNRFNYVEVDKWTFMKRC